VVRISSIEVNVCVCVCDL